MLIRRWTGPSKDAVARVLDEADPVQRPRYLRKKSAVVGDQQALDSVAIPRRIQELGTQGPHLAGAEISIPSGERSVEVVDRWRFRDELRRVQPRRLQRACGVQPCGPVYVGAGWQRGLCTCHSVHACPVCSARLRQARTTDVDDVIQWWRETEHGCVGMLTLTVRHARADSLTMLRKGLADSWRALWQSRRGQALRREAVEGYIRAVDVTWGPNGWHPHTHNLILCRTEPEPSWIARLRELWCSTVLRVMGKEFVPRDDEVGAHWTPNPPRSEYLLKLGLEVAAISTKAAAEGHATVWDIARRAVQEDKRGELSRQWRSLWREWSEGMLGSRQLTWSRGLRKRAGLAIELEPEQLDLDLELHPKNPNDWIVLIQPEDWRSVFGVNVAAKRWQSARRPSVLLNRSVRGLPQTISYLSRVGLVPSHGTDIELEGKPFFLVRMRQRSVLEVLGRRRE